MLGANEIRKKLGEVMDPELHISLTDLGLIYDIKVENDQINILMTLTTLGCPLFETIQDDIKTAIAELGVKEEQVEIELTFDPPWDMNRMSESAKAMLGI